LEDHEATHFREVVGLGYRSWITELLGIAIPWILV